jgi:hypothetical protein
VSRRQRPMYPGKPFKRGWECTNVTHPGHRPTSHWSTYWDNCRPLPDLSRCCRREDWNTGSERLQVTLVASPRNHLDLLCTLAGDVAIRLFAVCRYCENASEFARAVRCAVGFVRHERDFINQRADEFKRSSLAYCDRAMPRADAQPVVCRPRRGWGEIRAAARPPLGELPL